MKIKVYSQNALDGFSNKKYAREYIKTVQQLQPDIAFFAEAYKAGSSEQYLTQAIKAFKDQGYTVLAGPYDENDSRKDRHGMLLIISPGLVSSIPPRLIRVKDRNIAECWIDNNAKPLHFLGMHLNDRGETQRQNELDTLLDRVDTSNVPTIVAGDLNSLHQADARGKVFRKARGIHFLVRLKLMPITEPTGEPIPDSRGRQGSIYFRLHEMASGKTLRRLMKNGFHEADNEHQPTYPADRPIAQLDHILISHHITVKKFERLPAGNSDHLGIIAELEL